MEKKQEQDVALALHDKTGAMLMLNKKERRLLKELLLVTMKSESARGWIVKKLGSEYIEIGNKLLTSMGG
jgi:hypothetical protein